MNVSLEFHETREYAHNFQLCFSTVSMSDCRANYSHASSTDDGC
jgi:hypothetical protein